MIVSLGLGRAAIEVRHNHRGEIILTVGHTLSHGRHGTTFTYVKLGRAANLGLGHAPPSVLSGWPGRAV
jgi:hypothetical protein